MGDHLWEMLEHMSQDSEVIQDVHFYQMIDHFNIMSVSQIVALRFVCRLALDRHYTSTHARMFNDCLKVCVSVCLEYRFHATSPWLIKDTHQEDPLENSGQRPPYKAEDGPMHNKDYLVLIAHDLVKYGLSADDRGKLLWQMQAWTSSTSFKESFSCCGIEPVVDISQASMTPMPTYTHLGMYVHTHVHTGGQVCRWVVGRCTCG